MMRGLTARARPTTQSIAFDAGETVTVEGRPGNTEPGMPAEPAGTASVGYDVPRSGWPTIASGELVGAPRTNHSSVDATPANPIRSAAATPGDERRISGPDGIAPASSDDEFDQEVVDDVKLLLEEAARTPAGQHVASASSAQMTAGPPTAVGSNSRTKIFDDIAASMAHARSYDLGSVALDHRFDEFDREADARPTRSMSVTNRPLPPPSPSTLAAPTPSPTSHSESAAEFVEDLDLITAQGSPTDIPLDPGVGGRSIGESALEAGDVILSTTDHPLSDTIRRVTGAEVSHAALYIGGGKVVEAIEGGVKLRSLDTAIADDSLAVAYRHRDMTPVRASQAVAFAEQHARSGTPFDTWGLIQVAPGQLARAICNQREGAEREACLANAARLRVGTNDDGAFFCSELVLEAYASAGLTFVNTDPSWSSPGQIVELHHNGLFDYVGHLIA